MKRVIVIIVSVLIWMTFIVAVNADNEPVITKYKSKEAETLLWDEISTHSPSDAVTAGVLAYFWRESQFRSDSVSGWATLALDGFDLCQYVIDNTDPGLADGSSRDFFIETVRSCGGFGLGQWHSLGYLYDLYDFAQSYGTSMGDARMQCAFVVVSMQRNEELWSQLELCQDPKKAGSLIAIYYDGTVEGEGYIVYKSSEFYDRNAVNMEGET